MADNAKSSLKIIVENYVVLSQTKLHNEKMETNFRLMFGVHYRTI